MTDVDFPSLERQKALLDDWFASVHYDEAVDWREAEVDEDDDEAVVAGVRPRDGDGDGFVYDGTPRMRPWNPLTDLPYPDGEVPDAVKRRQQVARRKAPAPEAPGPKRPVERRPVAQRPDRGPATLPSVERIEDAFSYDDGEYRTEVSVTNKSGDLIHVEGSIVHYEDGGDHTKVGAFERFVFPKDGGVRSEFLSFHLWGRHRGKGVGSRIFASQVDGLRSAGVDTIEVWAVSDNEAGNNGAYTWARAGYDWWPGSRNLSVTNALRGDAEWQRRHGNDELADLAYDMADRLDVGDLPDDPADYPDDYPTPNDVAMLGWTPGAETWLGKEIMSGKATNETVRWHGLLDLRSDRPQLGVDGIGELPNPFAEQLPGGESGASPNRPVGVGPDGTVGWLDSYGEVGRSRVGNRNRWVDEQTNTHRTELPDGTKVFLITDIETGRRGVKEDQQLVGDKQLGLQSTGKLRAADAQWIVTLPDGTEVNGEVDGFLPGETAEEFTARAKGLALADAPDVEVPGEPTYMGRPVEFSEVDASDLTSTRVLAAYADIDGVKAPAGFVTWDRDTKEVELVGVQDNARNTGIGTELLRRAVELEPGLRPRENDQRSPGGEALIQQVWPGTPPAAKQLTETEANARAARMFVGLGMDIEDRLVDPSAETEVTFYEVGGAVRDDLMGIFSDDVDFAVTAPSYEAMKEHLEAEGFRIFQEREEFATIKAKVPDGHPLQDRTHVADFVLARRDGPSSDGRRPDYTEPGTLAEDLARRDFTVNAIARDVDGNLIDPFGGQEDIESRTLRFVGDPMQRVREDGLRVLRGFRFMVTKQLTPEPGTWAALTSDEAAEMLQSVSKERVSNELQKMLDYDTLGAVQLLGQLPTPVLDAIFRDGVRLAPNLGKVKGQVRDPDLPRNPFIPVDNGDIIELGSSPAGWVRKPDPNLPVRRADLPKRDVNDWSLPTKAELARAFLKDLPNGYQVRAQAFDDGVVVAKVYNPDGDEVGFANWKIRDDSPTAYLSLTQLIESEQGKGIGSQMFAAAVDGLRDLGVDTIELLAISSGNTNGGYTWARAGFDWEPGGWELPDLAVRLATFARDGRRKFDVTSPGDDGTPGTIRLAEPSGSPYSTEDQQEAFRIAALLTTLGDDLPYDPAEYPEDLPTPNDVAMIGWKPGATSWLGKDFLSGPDPVTGGAQSWDGSMRIDVLDAPDNPFAEQLDGGEVAAPAAAVPEPDVDLSSIVRTGNPHRWLSSSGLDRRYYASGDLSKRTVNARVAAVKKLVADELPQLKDKKIEIRYWTDWEEYREAVWPSSNTGSYPLAAWRDNGGADGGPAVWVSPSIATSWFDDDPSTITNWKVLVHELVHAASPQRVSNSGADAVLEEGAAEILSTDITARRIAEARAPFQQHRFDGGGTVPGIERLVRDSAYKERVAQLILHAADEEGVWDRDRIMARVRSWWDDGEYTSKYRRYELRGDARTREEMIEAETVKINEQYDDLIARLPQHAEEYEQSRRDLIEHLGTLYSTGNWQAEANTNWERMVASAEAAGVPIRRITYDRDGNYYQYESPPNGMTPEQHSEADGIADSLLYWLINGEAIDTAASEAGAVAAEGPIAP